MDYPEMLAKCDKQQEIIDSLHARIENLIAAGAIPMPAPLRLQALSESLESMRDELAPHISYDPA
jgi:hypothetical protein